MLIMLVLVTVVISGNGVFAAQRDTYERAKDVRTGGSGVDNANANAITNALYNATAVSNSNSNSNSHSSSSDGGIGISQNGNGNMTSYANGNGHKKAHVMANTTTSTTKTAFAHSTVTATRTIPSTAAATTTVKTTTTTTTAKTTSTKPMTTTTKPTATTTTTTTANTSTQQTPMSSSTSSSSSSLHINGLASRNLKKVSSATAGISGINRNTIEMTDTDTRSGPYFDKASSKNVTALLGKTAYLNCRVKNMGNRTMMLQVSWVRHRDIHLLTVGRYTYTSDQRFRAIHQPQTDDWMLQIKYPQHRDSGIYECQVSTIPHMSHYIHLNVVEPSTEIVGAPDMYIESGSTINLTCVVLNSPEPPAYIFWNHNDAIINYDSQRGGVAVVTNKGETTTSFLLMKSARPSDSGHYQCNPSNAKPKSVTVHVLNGEFPAAMQHAALARPCMSHTRYLLLYLFVCYCSSALAFVKRYFAQRLASLAVAKTVAATMVAQPQGVGLAKVAARMTTEAAAATTGYDVAASSTAATAAAVVAARTHMLRVSLRTF